MPTEYKYYPALSDLLTPEDLPDFLGFIKDGLDTVFSKMYYKDYQVSKSTSGSAAFYSLDIVSRTKLAMELPGTGVYFVLNPDYNDNAISSFPITVFWEWEVLRYLKSFNLSEFSFSAEDFYTLALQILNISEEQIVQLAIDIFVVQSNPALSKFTQLVQDINTLYGTSISIDDQSPDRIQELLIQLELSDKKIAPSVFALYLLATELETTKDNIQTFFSSFVPSDFEGYIKKILTPKARVTLGLEAAIEFPQNILKPVNDDGTVYPDPDVKTQFKFAKAQLYADTEAGIGYQMELGGSLYPDKAMIGNTGMLLELDSLKLDLSKKTNIPEADADNRTNDFVGAYVRTVGVALPSRWFNDNLPEGTPASTLKLSGYDLLVGTGGLSGSIMLEAVPGTFIGGSYYYDNEFALKYPVTLLQKNATTSIVEEITVSDLPDLKEKLFLGTNTSTITFKFPPLPSEQCH